MEREKTHFESTVAERRTKDKEFGRFVKNYKKYIRKTSTIKYGNRNSKTQTR